MLSPSSSFPYFIRKIRCTSQLIIVYLLNIHSYSLPNPSLSRIHFRVLRLWMLPFIQAVVVRVAQKLGAKNQRTDNKQTEQNSQQSLKSDIPEVTTIDTPAPHSPTLASMSLMVTNRDLTLTWGFREYQSFQLRRRLQLLLPSLVLPQFLYTNALVLLLPATSAS